MVPEGTIRFHATRFTVYVTNPEKGRIAEWKGLQGQAVVLDDGANRFESLPDASDIGGDSGSRIEPGETYQAQVWFPPGVAGLRTVTFAFSVPGSRVRVKGELETTAKVIAPLEE
jgi:hypothetical protein